jgi:cell division protein FtsN
MSKDYKRPEPQPRSSGSTLLIGILIGLVMGLGIALGVAWYINKMPNPFLPQPPATKSEPAKSAAPAPAKDAQKAASATDGKPEEPSTNEKSKAAAKKEAAAKETFFLQAGAFQNAPDADNLKARLALLGIEASIQTATVADKGVWHRVRVGPYTSVAELNRMRDALKQNGVETTLIKVQDARPSN